MLPSPKLVEPLRVDGSAKYPVGEWSLVSLSFRLQTQKSLMASRGLCAILVSAVAGTSPR